MIDYTAILSRKYIGSQWSLNGDSYQGLVWLSKTDKPTKKELDDLWPEVQKEMQLEIEAKAQAKLAAETKLVALGLTLSDLKALLS